MQKKRLLLDVDDVICESCYLEQFNKFFGTNYVIEDFKDFFIDHIIKSKDKRFEYYEHLVNVDIYENARLKENCYEVMLKLNEVYDIYICSACVMPDFAIKSGICFKHKYDFLIRNFPFLDPNKFILTCSKNVILADVQIDDRPNNLENQTPTRLLFTAYHNKELTDEELKEKGIVRVNNWRDIEKILL